MEVLVRVDNSHSKHGWNWVNGHFLSMDKGTTREMLGAQVFKVEIQTPQGPEIASFFSRRPGSEPGEESLRFNSEEARLSLGKCRRGRLRPCVPRNRRPRKRGPPAARKIPKNQITSDRGDQQ